jgi:hypothetical protein
MHSPRSLLRRRAILLRIVPAGASSTRVLCILRTPSTTTHGERKGKLPRVDVDGRGRVRVPHEVLSKVLDVDGHEPPASRAKRSTRNAPSNDDGASRRNANGLRVLVPASCEDRSKLAHTNDVHDFTVG